MKYLDKDGLEYYNGKIQTKLNGKQNTLTSQTAYSSKGSATKVPQITTNSLGQVTNISEVTITQPTVNNGTLTIQKNGSNVQTFTANQSSNVTANITVPTQTSELTNNSGFITSSGNVATATTLQTIYFNRNNNSNTWAKVATCSLAATYNENHAYLFIKGTHNSNYKQNGIIAIDAVGNNTKGKISTYAAQFMSSTTDLNLENFYIEKLDGDDNTPGVVNFWVRINTNAWASWQVKILQNSGWTIGSAAPSTTTLPSTGYTGKNAERVGYVAKSIGDKNGDDITTTYYKASNPNGYTSNIGTITGITMNGASKGTSGVVDLGTVLTSHQTLKTVNNNSITGSGNVSVGTITGVSINSSSIATSGVADIKTNGTYNASSNKIATMSDIPSLSNYYYSNSSYDSTHHSLPIIRQASAFSIPVLDSTTYKIDKYNLPFASSISNDGTTIPLTSAVYSALSSYATNSDMITMRDEIYGNVYTQTEVNNLIQPHAITIYNSAEGTASVSTAWGVSKFSLTGTLSKVGSKLSISNGAVLVGNGVNHVKISGNVLIKGASGTVQAQIFIGGTRKTMAYNYTSSTGQYMSCSMAPMIVAVSSGQSIELRVGGSAAATYTMSGGGNTYLTVEVVD